MQVIVDGAPTTFLVQTVSTVRDEKRDSLLFRCYHCGTALQRVVGLVVKISAGLTPTSETITLLRCYKCGENYTFQTLLMTSPYTELTLSPEPDRDASTFHCIVCRTPLLQYNSKVAFTLPTIKYLKPPSDFECDICHHKYILKEIVSLTDEVVV